MTTFVKACSDLGVHISGSELGPLELNKYDNEVDSVIVLKKDDVKKEVESGNKKRNIKYVNKFNKELYEKIVNTNDFVVTIGGDHAIAIGSSLGAKKKYKNIGLFWIDAHSDYHNMDSTISGNLHGMPFASVSFQNGNYLTSFYDDSYFDPKKTVLIGGRDIEDAEYINLEKAGVTVFTTEDIKKYGVKEIIDKAFQIVSGLRGVHISYDLDVIDPVIAPGVSVKASCGINKEEAFEILEELLKRKELITSFDLVEFNPLLDKDNKTKEIAEHILERVIKEKRA